MDGDIEQFDGDRKIGWRIHSKGALGFHRLPQFPKVYEQLRQTPFHQVFPGRQVR
jgi:hypothetical protein